MNPSQQEVLNRAAMLGGPGSVPTITDGDLFRLPTFEEQFEAGAWTLADGKIVLRYPTFGDEVEIERLAVLNGGTLLARAFAALTVCLIAAPESWYRPATKAGDDPVPAIDRLPCSPEIVGLWQRWLSWRDSFRRHAPGPAEGASV